MADENSQTVDPAEIRALLEQKKGSMKLRLAACAGCTLCAESCFMFMNKGQQDPQYMPSYKVLNSLGKLYRKKGKVGLADLEKMRKLIWENCVLCERCYCPIGVDLPSMIAFARRVLRSQGVDGAHPRSDVAGAGDNGAPVVTEKPAE